MAVFWGALFLFVVVELALNEKQKRFCEEYLVDMNGTQAAIRAGYSKKTAQEQSSRLLSNAIVQEYVAKLRQEQQERTKIDADWVLKQAVELHLRCMQDIKPVINPITGEQMTDEDGNRLFRFDASGAAKGLELAGRNVLVQAFKDVSKVEGSLSVSLSGEEQGL